MEGKYLALDSADEGSKETDKWFPPCQLGAGTDPVPFQY